MLVQIDYNDYRDNIGLKYPAQIVQRRGGQPTFDAQILGAHANPPNLQALMTPPPPPPPPAGRTGRRAERRAPPPATASEKLADGVYRITGGYVALAVEFRDHSLVFEPAGQNEARAQAIIDEVKRVIPNKPIRYGVLSHHHFDHTSGLPAVVAEGITIVTHEANKAFLENALGAPRTLAPDSMARSGKKAVIETVGDKRVFTDGRAHARDPRHQRSAARGRHADRATCRSEKIVAYADMFNLPSHRAAARAESAGRRHAGIRRESRAARPRLRTSSRCTRRTRIGRSSAPTSSRRSAARRHRGTRSGSDTDSRQRGQAPVY